MDGWKKAGETISERGNGKDGQNGDLCLPIIPLDVAQSFPRNCFSTVAEIQFHGKSCNVNVATSPALAVGINLMEI